MFAVTVFGYVPDKEIGEVPYTSYVYHVLTEGTNVKFLVWNPHARIWEFVGKQSVQPMSIAAQNVDSNDGMRRYNELLRKRQREQGNV